VIHVNMLKKWYTSEARVSQIHVAMEENDSLSDIPSLPTKSIE